MAQRRICGFPTWCTWSAAPFFQLLACSCQCALPCRCMGCKVVLVHCGSVVMASCSGCMCVCCSDRAADAADGPCASGAGASPRAASSCRPSPRAAVARPAAVCARRFLLKVRDGSNPTDHSARARADSALIACAQTGLRRPASGHATRQATRYRLSQRRASVHASCVGPACARVLCGC